MNYTYIWLSCVVSSTLVACGGGESGGSQKNTTAKSVESYIDVKVIDGYIRGANAYIDINNNRRHDDNEPSITTGKGGKGRIVTTDLGLTADKVSVVVNIPAGSLDESTITPAHPEGIVTTPENAYQMLSLPGETTITPLTTLVALATKNGDVEAAKQNVANTLGIKPEEISSDYLNKKNNALTVLAELLIKNSVIPKHVSDGVTNNQLLVASVASAKISAVVHAANAAGRLTTDKAAIEASSTMMTQVINTIASTYDSNLATAKHEKILATMNVATDTVAKSFKALTASNIKHTANDIALASEHAKIMSQVVIELLNVDPGSSESISAETIETATTSAAVISKAVKELIITNKGKEPDHLSVKSVSEIALIAAKKTASTLIELSKSNPTAIAKDAKLTEMSNGAQSLVNAIKENTTKSEVLVEVKAKVEVEVDSTLKEIETDSDGDKHVDSKDAFPRDPKEWLDSDGDYIGDNSDADLLADIGLERVFTNYFDIAIGAKAGQSVIGTIQLAANRKATFGDRNFNDHHFVLAGSQDNGKYTLENIHHKGRIHGLIKVAEGHEINAADSTTLRIELKKSGKVISRFDAAINVAEKTQWKTYYERLTAFAKTESRMWGRRDSLYGDVRPKATQLSAEEVLLAIEKNDGKFTDLRIYTIDQPKQLLTFNEKDNIAQFEEAANRIGGLGYALMQLKDSDGDKRKRLINGIVKGFNAYANLMPVAQFDDFGADTRVGFGYSDRTHQWRFLDPVSLPVILAFEDSWEMSGLGDKQASLFIDNIYSLYQIAFALPYQERFDRTRTSAINTRSFLAKDVSKSPGVWNDANRHHRIRSWATMVVRRLYSVRR